MTVFVQSGAPGIWASRVMRAADVVRLSVISAVVRAVTPHKAAIGNLKAIPLTVAGTGCIDFAGFHIAHGWGWLITGISLVLLEHLIADQE